MHSRQNSKVEFVDIDSYIQNLKEKTKAQLNKTNKKPTFQKEEGELLERVKTDLSQRSNLLNQSFFDKASSIADLAQSRRSNLDKKLKILEERPLTTKL